MSNGAIVRQVLVAWAVGLVIAGVIYGPIVAVSQGEGPVAALRELRLIPLYMLLSFTLGVMISLPLIVLATIAALALGPRAAQRPVFWSTISTLVGGLCYAVGDAIVRGDLFSGGPSFALRPTHPVLIADIAIISVAIFGGALFYCLRLARNLGIVRGGSPWP